jgi:DNA-directed RNA polymerase specialized sigma24 family protein
MTKKKHHKKIITEQELLQTIEIISKKLAYKFKFGYHELEDMKQQISIFALEGLKNYDYKRPLENFLWTHVRNRLFNYKRDNYQRPDKPCLTCPLYDSQLQYSTSGCKKYNDKLCCDLYNSWYHRNNSKKNLMHLNNLEDIQEIFPQKHNNPEKVSNNEIIDIIESKLNGEYRKLYLKYKNGTKISKSDLSKLVAKIQEVLDE